MADLSSLLSGLSPEQRNLLLQRLNELTHSEAPATVIARHHADGPAPLSFAQERLWFLDQLDPGSPVFNLTQPVRLVGPLVPAVLAAALREVARRHGSLRTTFGASEGRPFQLVAPTADLALPVLDLEGLGARVEDEALRLASREAARPFDLGRGPLVRASLLRLGREHHWVLFAMHHIVSDGWSM